MTQCYGEENHNQHQEFKNEGKEGEYAIQTQNGFLLHIKKKTPVFYSKSFLTKTLICVITEHEQVECKTSLSIEKCTSWVAKANMIRSASCHVEPEADI